jgi:hypothetical protein
MRPDGQGNQSHSGEAKFMTDKQSLVKSVNAELYLLFKLVDPIQIKTADDILWLANLLRDLKRHRIAR